jgi:hypothetical protein
VISRLLRGSQEPRSIFEHIDAHVRPGVAGLTPGGEVLPDEPPASGSEIRWAPGALEGVTLGMGAEDAEAAVAVDQIYRALAALARKPSQANRRRLRELFQEGEVRWRIDPLRDRLSAESPPNAVELYPELRELFLRSGYRDEVKYAMALMAGFGRPEDADLFRVIGRHEEFTLYAAVALGSVSGDPVEEWLDLLTLVPSGGWGRTELSQLILREPRSELVRERLLRNGLGVGNALTLAGGCQLAELLARPQVDDELLDGACAVVEALVWESRDLAADLADYDEAGAAVEALLRHICERVPDLGAFVTVFELRRFLRDERDERFEACGLGDERLVAQCTAFLDGDHWQAQVESALESADEDERSLALEVAARLGLDNSSYLLERLAREPGDAGLWCKLLADADEARMQAAVGAALALWDLGEIARGPALDLIEFGDGPLASVPYFLQELPRFPGVAGALLEASLQSPVISQRMLALRALARWEHLPATLVERVAETRAGDPDEDVRELAASVLVGEP